MLEPMILVETSPVPSGLPVAKLEVWGHFLKTPRYDRAQNWEAGALGSGIGTPPSRLPCWASQKYLSPLGAAFVGHSS